MLRALATSGILLAVILSGAWPAAAFHREDVPLVGTGGDAGAGWAALKLATDGSIVVVDVEATGVGTTMVALYLFDAQDRLVFGFSFTTLEPPADGTVLDVAMPPAGNVRYGATAPTEQGGGMGAGFTLNDPSMGTRTPGTFKVLVWVAGDVETWSWSLRGGAGTRLLANGSGSSAFLYDADDFVAPAHSRTYSGGTGARALVAERVVVVEHSLYGVFYDANAKLACAGGSCASAPGTLALSYADPSGRTTSCAGGCAFDAAAAGAYSFRLAGADASASPTLHDCALSCAWVAAFPDHVVLGGSDALLPP